MAEITKETLAKIEEKIKKQYARGKYGYADKCLLSKDKEVVLHTMLIVGELRIDKYVDPIAQVVSDAVDPVFRKTAAEALGLMLNERALYQLIKRLEIEKDASVAAAISDTVKKIHNKEPEAD